MAGPWPRELSFTSINKRKSDMWDSEDTNFLVVVNHEEQYSIWPDYLDMPKGWKAVGKSGKKQECLDHIKEVWTDMRPLSLRKAMAGESP
jgi:MbtH protein